MPSLTKPFEIMVKAILRKNLVPLMLKHNNDSYLQEDGEPYATYIFLCTVKSMLSITSVFLQLVEIIPYQK